MFVNVSYARAIGGGFLDKLTFEDPSAAFSVTATTAAGVLKQRVPESVPDFDAQMTADGAVAGAWASAKAAAAAAGFTLDQLVEATKRAIAGA
jgi:hypothetical protein